MNASHDSWISVEDELPEIGYRVLAFPGRWIEACIASRDEHGIWRDNVNQREERVTFWQELPEQPVFKEMRAAGFAMDAGGYWYNVVLDGTYDDLTWINGIRLRLLFEEYWSAEGVVKSSIAPDHERPWHKGEYVKVHMVDGPQKEERTR